MDLLFNTIGTLGVILVMAAYFLLQKRLVTVESLSYPLLNIIGSTLVIISLINNWNLPSFIIQVCFILISVYGIYKNILRKKA